MSDVDHHVQALPAVRRHRAVQRRIRTHDELLEVGPFAARPQSDPRLVPRRRDVARERVDTEVHPRAVVRRLDRARTARLAAARRAVQHDDCARRFHRVIVTRRRHGGG
jgi:hypothetical protein